MIKVELTLCCDEPNCPMSARVMANLTTDYMIMFDEHTIPPGWRLRRGYPGPEWGNPSIFCACSVHNNYSLEETNGPKSVVAEDTSVSS